MMRIALALFPLLAPAVAAAQSQAPEQSVQVVATAPSLCRMASPAATGDATFTTGPSGGVLQLSELVDNDGVANALTVALTIEVICTGPHDVRIDSASGGLANLDAQAETGPGFSDHLDYRLDGEWDGQVFGFTTSGVPTAASLSENGPARGAFGMNLTLSGGARLVAGEYQDELTVTFNPR